MRRSCRSGEYNVSEVFHVHFASLPGKQFPLRTKRRQKLLSVGVEPTTLGLQNFYYIHQPLNRLFFFTRD